jgi:hypothetical protein
MAGATESVPSELEFRNRASRHTWYTHGFGGSRRSESFRSTPLGITGSPLASLLSRSLRRPISARRCAAFRELAFCLSIMSSPNKPAYSCCHSCGSDKSRCDCPDSVELRAKPPMWCSPHLARPFASKSFTGCDPEMGAEVIGLAPGNRLQGSARCCWPEKTCGLLLYRSGIFGHHLVPQYDSASWMRWAFESALVWRSGSARNPSI